LILVVIAVWKTFNWRQQKCLIAFVIDKKTDSVDNYSFVMTKKITMWIQGITTHFWWHNDPHCGHAIHALDNYPVRATYMTYFLCEQHIWPTFSAESFNLWESGICWFSGTNEMNIAIFLFKICHAHLARTCNTTYSSFEWTLFFVGSPLLWNM